MDIIRKVPTDMIERAIDTLKSRKLRTVQLYSYALPSFAPTDEISTEQPAAYTLPDLYRELARRLDEGTDVLHRALEEFKN